ncbi:MAG: hypothetical protein R3337_11670 [Gammaproteobacteria bacterium]|nr:hypothetical protein [Gammaproteobacteria bacterium]
MVANVAPEDTVTPALSKSGINFQLYTGTPIEPTDQTFLAASKFPRQGCFED